MNNQEGKNRGMRMKVEKITNGVSGRRRAALVALCVVAEAAMVAACIYEPRLAGVAGCTLLDDAATVQAGIESAIIVSDADPVLTAGRWGGALLVGLAAYLLSKVLGAMASERLQGGDDA